MDRENIERICSSLRPYSRLRSSLKMSKTELANMPKEIIITYATREMALGWDKLLEHL